MKLFLFQTLHFQSPLITLFSLATILIPLHYANALNLPNNETVPALIVFGDSVVDTGNNNYINTNVKSNFLPYGKDFGAGNQPTGRFSNGLVLSDIIGTKHSLFVQPTCFFLLCLLTIFFFSIKIWNQEAFTCFSWSKFETRRSLNRCKLCLCWFRIWSSNFKISSK